MKKLVIILIILCGVVIYYATTIGIGVAEIVCNAVNVREGPGLSYRVIGTIKRAQKVSIIEYTNQDWVKVRLANKRTGYITASPEFVHTSMVDLPFNVQQIASIFQKGTEQDYEIKTPESGTNETNIGSVGYIQTGMINLEQYKNTIELEALETKTIAEQVFLSSGEYTITLRFSKKGLGVSIVTEEGNRFEWAAKKDNDIIDEKIHISASDSGIMEVFSGTSGGEIRIAIQKH